MTSRFSGSSSGSGMASATDIITFVGIPLAVLGVLPTLYTVIKSYLTLRAVRRHLAHNGVASITRSALLTGIVEVEIPRKSITPLDRTDEHYFKPAKVSSGLRGGSWTQFNWKEMVIGVKSYRLQYHDELRQPQAEVDFEQLIAFLLDRGAVPSADGFGDLRSSGLWTPAGTKLLLSPCTSDPVLVVSPPDDSDGILSVAVYWDSTWDKRDHSDLPPYWVRLRAGTSSGKTEENAADVEKEKSGVEAEDVKSSTEDPFDEERADSVDAAKPARHTVEKQSKPPIRLRLGATGIQDAYAEDLAEHRIKYGHLHTGYGAVNSMTMWFSCAATAIGAPKGGLWSYGIPDDILSLTKRNPIPCGAMVLLGLMTDEEVPDWRTPEDKSMENLERSHRLMEQGKAIAAEQRMPPAQREAARKARVDREFTDWIHENRKRAIEIERKKEQEVNEAINSQKLTNKVVADANRKWLAKNGHVEAGTPLDEIVEGILYEMLEHEHVALAVADMLDHWKRWAESGGIGKADLEIIRGDVLSFSYASCILCLIRETSTTPAGAIVSDLQECLRIWKKVRLG